MNTTDKIRKIENNLNMLKSVYGDFYNCVHNKTPNNILHGNYILLKSIIDNAIGYLYSIKTDSINDFENYFKNQKEKEQDKETIKQLND